MTQANTHISTIRNIYFGGEGAVADVESEATEQGGTIDQDWDNETTIIIYPDGSRIVMSGSQCDVG